MFHLSCETVIVHDLGTGGRFTNLNTLATEGCHYVFYKCGFLWATEDSCLLSWTFKYAASSWYLADVHIYILKYIFFPFFGHPATYGVSGPGIISEPQLRPTLQLHRSFNPLCRAGHWTYLLVLQRCHWSCCATGGTPSCLSFWNISFFIYKRRIKLRRDGQTFCEGLKSNCLGLRGS